MSFLVYLDRVRLDAEPMPPASQASRRLHMDRMESRSREIAKTVSRASAVLYARNLTIVLVLAACSRKSGLNAHAERIVIRGPSIRLPKGRRGPSEPR
jgi:hypothetical protein